MRPFCIARTAVACEGVCSAKMAWAINNANVFCMGGRIVGPEMAVEMVTLWLLCRPTSPQAQKGAFIGITGQNVTLSI